MKTVSINLYSFDELSDKAKERAISDHKDFLDGNLEQFEDENGEMQSEYVDHNDADSIESIQANEYLFYFDGKLARTCQFTDNHPTKPGVNEFYFHGETFTF